MTNSWIPSDDGSQDPAAEAHAARTFALTSWSVEELEKSERFIEDFVLKRLHDLIEYVCRQSLSDTRAAVVGHLDTFEALAPPQTDDEAEELVADFQDRVSAEIGWTEERNFRLFATLDDWRDDLGDTGWYDLADVAAALQRHWQKGDSYEHKIEIIRRVLNGEPPTPAADEVVKRLAELYRRARGEADDDTA
ncbi:hypothetical protein AR457_10160 [Streptomyces agglomeratus]|uniref:hypothetical protein n=1 Tax=Streptomyces agglomeratus TaxID=285458 RepID=UPI0008547B20|nr:hypothetical protein [Streptomyces agglomeratus]OEJ41210.1 hypothetical protein BGK70_26495 [Streptomyces agglomeratus]OEJ44413.1 hypothetical protein AR457_10160 [Streptomyces agglomeratus]